MKRIFITGLSGTGKSSVIQELQSRGFTAIDTDYDDWCEFSTAGGEPEYIWREDRMHELLSSPLRTPLFVSGCYSNQGKFYRYFDHKVLLSAPLEVMRERVMGRSDNPYGKNEEEWAEICVNFEMIQPLLRKSADLEIDTAEMCIQQMADYLYELALT